MAIGGDEDHVAEILTRLRASRARLATTVGDALAKSLRARTLVTESRRCVDALARTMIVAGYVRVGPPMAPDEPRCIVCHEVMPSRARTAVASEDPTLVCPVCAAQPRHVRAVLRETAVARLRAHAEREPISSATASPGSSGTATPDRPASRS